MVISGRIYQECMSVVWKEQGNKNANLYIESELFYKNARFHLEEEMTHIMQNCAEQNIRIYNGGVTWNKLNIVCYRL